MARFSKIAVRVADRYASSLREEAKALTHPINAPHGIARDIVRDHGRSVNHRQDVTKPERNDLRPEDVFAGTPNQMNVLNLVQTGRDSTHALDKQIPKDRGHDVVHNLSQYLIETKGGGSGGPEGRK